MSENLRKDIEIGRHNACAFANIFLTNASYYGKKYLLAEPFNHPDCFDSPDGRKRFVKAVLAPCSYKEQCITCKQKHQDKFYHFLNECHQIAGIRKEMFLKLDLYNFPTNQLPLNKTEFLKLVLRNRTWRKCLSDFLIDTNF